MAAKKSFKIIFVNPRHVRVCVWEVPEGTDLSEAGVIRLDGKYYTFQYLVHGEFAAQYMETSVFTVPD